MTEAVVPDNPVEPNLKLNVAIAGVLALFLGVFIAFMLEFFQATDWSQFEQEKREL